MPSEGKSIENSHEKISPTAYGIAWRRASMQIPYATEIFEQLKQNHLISEEDFAKVMQVPEMTPFFEARYKIINKFLKEIGIKQVLEIASGLAPRGLELTQDSSNTYVELDLPNMIREKERIVGNVMAKESRPNLHFVEGNALSKTDVEKAMSIFKLGEKIAITNEGFFRYYSLEEQARVASQIILPILKERPGSIWVTTDIPIAIVYEQLAKLGDKAKEFSDDIDKMTGVNKEKNYFKNKAEAKASYEKMGFEVESHSFLEIYDQLNSSKILGMSAEAVRSTIENSVVFIMKAK